MDPLEENFKELKISGYAKTGLVYNEQMLLHSPAPKKHYENPSRLEAIMSHLNAKSLINHPNLDFVEHINPALDSCIMACHPPNYIEYVAEMFPAESEKKSIFIFDSYFNKHTNLSARIAISSVNLCVDKVLKNEWKNAYALIRPPGHHSGHHTTINGFCVFNNVAIATKYAQRLYNVKKILIFDWDIHHGDGTEHIFYKDPSVLYASIHRYENGHFYPNHGSSDRIGEGEGKGYNINIGWDVGEETVTNDDYIYVFERILMPIFREFEPELVFVSAGFDSCKGDPLGDIDLGQEGFAYMLRKLQELAKGRIILALEGGYNTKSISLCSETVIRILLGESFPLECFEVMVKMDELLDRCKPCEISLKAAEIALNSIRENWSNVLDTKELKDLQENMELNSFFALQRKKNVLIRGETFFKKSTETEKYFYTQPNNCFEGFLCNFHGIETLYGVEYLKLGNLFHGKWNKISFLEMKLGKRTFRPDDHNEEKIAARLKKDETSTSSFYGFRITNGVILGKNNEKKIVKKGECYSKLAKIENNLKLIKEFILNQTDDKEKIKKAVEYFIQKLENLRECGKIKSFVSNSLIFLLDLGEMKWDLKIVDFSCKQKDENEESKHLFQGIENLINFLLDLIK